jgi:hypothetical protein
MKTILGVAGAVLLAISLASCGSTAEAKPASSPTATPKPTTYYGESAPAIAALIRDCTDVKAGDVAKGGPDLASTASCVLGGRTIDINSWRDIHAIDSMRGVIKANKEEVYYATGNGWSAHVRRDMSFQYQITNQADKLLAMAFAKATPPAPDLRGEQEASKAISDTFGGLVEHFQP